MEVSQGMNDVSGLLTGHFAQWFEASWKTFRLAARMGNYPFYLFGSLAILLILAGRRAWRAYGVFLAVCFGSVLLYKGQNEILRYHSLVYAAAGSAVGLLCLAALSRVRGVVLLIAAMMAWLGLVGMFVVKQNEWASLRTVQWPYRPVLSQADVIARATFTEKGPLYTQLREASQFIPRESVVFLPDCNFPFYLKRNMIWGDAVMENGVGKTFLRSSPENALLLLQRTQADSVLILDSRSLALGPVPDLLKSGHLRLTNKRSGWHLFAYTPSIGQTK